MTNTTATKLELDSPEFVRFVDACQTMVTEHSTSRYPTLTVPVLTVEKGSKFFKLVKNDGQTMVFAFVDRTNGDVLKPATWRAPAKHARGNINDYSFGMAKMGPYGPAYLK